MSVQSAFLAIICFAANCAAQNASLTGSVKDPQGAVVPTAVISLVDLGKQVAVKTVTNETGIYEFPILRPGTYELKAEAPGFQISTVSPIPLEVDQRGRADVVLSVSGAATSVEVTAAGVSAVETESSSIGDVIGSKTISEIPLNGRFFLDLAVLVPGSVMGSTNNRNGNTAASAFGSFSINSSGARSDSASFLIDGINMNDGTQITFQPSVESVQEFKVQSNAFSAEYGRTAGIIINGVTKSGSNSFHGSLFEFFRNDKLDALNFFDPSRAVEKERTGAEIAPFKRNIFGESVGGPVLLPGYNGRNRTFFFEDYEGRRLRETETFTTTVPTVAQRAAVTNPVVAQLLTLLPLPNNPGVTVNNFTGQAPRNFTLDNTTIRIDHSINSNNLVFGTFILQPDNRNEASSLGTHNIPGFGDYRVGRRKLLALGYTHIFAPNLTGEFRTGGNRINLEFAAQSALTGLSPVSFGIIGDPGNFPDIRISGGPTFGGISGYPQGRTDTTYQANYALSWFKGKHARKFGFEYRVFYNNAHNGGTGGQINFSSISSFLTGTPTTTSIRVGVVNPALSIRSFAYYVEDDYKILPRLTLNLGLRYEYNGVPMERHNNLAVFDFATNKLVQVGTNGVRQYDPDHFDFGPRIGFSWDPFGKAKTVIRAGAGLYYDVPLLSVTAALANNPPFATNSTFTYTGILLANPFAPGSTSALSPTAMTPDYKGARVPQYNFNIQQQAWSTVFQVGYIGSVGRRLAIQRDFNQGIAGIRPIAGYGQVNLNGSTARSSYNALWVSANRRLAKGLTFDASWTFSKSIDTASTSGNAQIQNSYDVNSEKALSDFDARHRVVASVLYQFPWKARRLKLLANDWSMSVVANYQSGNPFSPIISSLRSGSQDTNDRPDIVYGQSLGLADPDPAHFFNTAAFVVNQTNHFGNAGRNILTGPVLRDADISFLKLFPVRESLAVQFRAQCFNVTNTPNFGQPGNSVTAANFGVIQTTRSQRGDFGSSRQIEFALKILF